MATNSLFMGLKNMLKVYPASV